MRIVEGARQHSRRDPHALPFLNEQIGLIGEPYSVHSPRPARDITVEVESPGKGSGIPCYVVSVCSIEMTPLAIFSFRHPEKNVFVKSHGINDARILRRKSFVAT